MGVKTIGRKKITVTIPLGGAAQKISDTTLFATDIEVFFPSANSSASGYFGDSTVDTTWIPRTKGVPYNFTHGEGTLDARGGVLAFDLSKLYVLSSVGDTCIVEYMAIVN